MKPLRDEDQWTPEDCRHAAYRLGHGFARQGLRDGKPADAIRFGMRYMEEHLKAQGSPSSEDLDVEKWRGLEDALAGRPLDPRYAGEDCSG